MTMESADTNLGRIGRCIYCGSTDSLTTEHVIPLGLGGPAKLYEASCKPCAQMTSAFERLVQRDQLGPFRARMGLPTRRPKDRPTSFPARVRTAEGWQDVQLPADKYTAVGLFPRFPPPGAAVGRPAGERIRLSYVSVALDPRDGIGHDPAKRAGVDALEQTVQAYPLAFVQMLAKIAWGFSVSEIGLDRLDPAIIGVIKGTDQDPFRWVGSMPKGESGFDVPPTAGWQVRVQERGPFVLAWIRLFATYGTPEYVVVVGRTTGPPPTSSA